MKYITVDDENNVNNIIVADSSFAESHGALPYYDGAAIGQPYDPPKSLSLEERVVTLENELSRIKDMYVNNGENAAEMKGENTYAEKQNFL